MYIKNMLSADRIQQLIDFGINRNMLVYDMHAHEYIITKYLIYHMVKSAPKSEVIYIPKDIFIEFIPTTQLITDTVYCFGRLLLTQSGLEWDKYRRADTMGQYVNYYLNVEKGVLPSNKHSLCIAAPLKGLPNNDNTVLGCC